TNPARPGDGQEQRARPMVPESDRLVMAVAGQEVPRVAVGHVGDLPTVAGQDTPLPRRHPVPYVDLVVVAGGRKEFPVRMPRHCLDASGFMMPARPIIGGRMPERTQELP